MKRITDQLSIRRAQYKNFNRIPLILSFSQPGEGTPIRSVTIAENR